MDVLILTYSDDANSSYGLYMSLKSVNYNVTAFKGCYHPFHYENQLDVYKGMKKCIIKNKYNIPHIKPDNFITQLINDNNIIILEHSLLVDFTNIDIKNKIIIPYHGGSNYRKYNEYINDFYNPICRYTFIKTADLLGLGAKNEIYMRHSIANDYFMFYIEEPNDILTIGHFPSNPNVKGSDIIIPTLIEYEKSNNIKYVGIRHMRNNIHPHSENILRMSNCDIYVEMLKPILLGKQYGVGVIQR